MPTDNKYDVLVCGAGPAGISAAIAAARNGARVLLAEAGACLGGVMGNAMVGSFCDSPGGPVFDELAKRLLELGAAHWRVDPERFRPPGRLAYHSETARALAMEMVLESGAEAMLNASAARAIMDGARVVAVELAAKPGLVRVEAAVTIDCTGDADVAASAGAPFAFGDPEDGRIQVCNFRWRMGGADLERFRRDRPPDERLEAMCRDAVSQGMVRPPEFLFAQDAETFPFDRAYGGLRLNNWELRGVNPADARQTSRALAQCQLAALQLVRFCRSNLPGYENCSIERFPAALGTRESRRIEGHYTLTRGDVVGGAKFQDGIAKAWFWIDLHDPPPGLTIPYGLEYRKANQPPLPEDWYEIPYRCLLPRKTDALLVAGRCVSCDRAAQGSLRVMPTCMFMGAAAGTAAAWAASEGISPGQIDGRRLKREMLRE